MPKKLRGLGDVGGARGLTIRFSREQVEALEDIRYRHAREVHSFADAFRALIARPKWLKESEIQKGVRAFWDSEADADANATAKGKKN